MSILPACKHTSYKIKKDTHQLTINFTLNCTIKEEKKAA